MQESADRAERRGLAGAIGAYQRDDLVLLDRDRDALERFDVVVEDVDVVYFEERHGVSLRPEPVARSCARPSAGARPPASPTACRGRLRSPWDPSAPRQASP